MSDFKITITPSFETPNANEENLYLEVDIAGRVTREVLNLKEKATTDALNALGWASPNTVKALEAKNQALIEALEEAESALKMAADHNAVNRGVAVIKALNTINKALEG